MQAPYKIPMKLLGVLMGPTVEGVVNGEERGQGALEELLDLPESSFQVRAAPRMDC